MILTLQQGGGIPPFADYTPVSIPTASASEKKSSTSKDDSDDLGIKDILELIKGVEGLPNDSAFVTKQLNSLLNRASVYPLRSQDIASVFSQIFASIQRLKHHKQEYENARIEAKNNGALSEVAVTDSGMLVAYDLENKKITTVSTDEARESSQYRVLTNSDLLNLNSQNSDYIFDNSLLDVVENGIGMAKIDQFIRNAITTIGTDEVSQSGYSVQEQNDIIAGLKVIKEHQQGMALDGVYQNTTKSKTQIRQARKALKYVYSMLPQNAKTLLRYKTGSDEKALELIQDFIQSKVSTSQELDSDYQTDLAVNKLGEKTKEPEGMKITAPIAFLNRKGPSFRTEINPGTSFAFNVTEYKGNITKDNSNLKANSSLLDVIGSDFNPLLDTNNISFGGVRISADQGGLVVVPSSTIYDVELPINMNPSSPGLISPDILLTKRMEEADNEIRLHGITDKDKINEIYAKHTLPPKYDSNGKLNRLRYARFARIPVVLTEEALDKKAKVDGTVSKVEDKNRRNGIERAIQKTYNKYDIGEGFWGIGKDIVYEGQIYMPLINDSNNSLIVTKQYPEVPQISASDLQEQDYNRQKASTYNNPGGLAIYMQ